jgi:hypothetical protein
MAQFKWSYSKVKCEDNFPMLFFKLITYVYIRKSVSDHLFVVFIKLNFILTYETFNGKIMMECETFSTEL